MTTSAIEIRPVFAQDVLVTEDSLVVDLSDGRSISVPVAWYPRLLHATPQERNNWRLVGRGEGIHWPDLDEDISVRNILEGGPSNESPGSLKEWLAKRAVPADQLDIQGKDVQACPG